jgi:hypothetical protein
MNEFQRQLDTRALEIASQANARVDGLEKLLTVSINGIERQIAENRISRDQQHAEGESHFASIDKKFEQITKLQWTVAGSTIMVLLTMVGALVAPHLR